MAEKLKSSLQESEEVPRDFTALFDHTLHSLDMKVLPDVLKYVCVSVRTCVCVCVCVCV